ncbi:MAG: hypothetical protein RL021_2018, partial [Bacteroidota bacterium]|jgi:lipopolysaccharide transport system permease protein
MEYEIKPSRRFGINFRELWNYRELFYFFTWRDIKIKYKQAFLGIAWAVLQPVIMMFVFSLFFGQALGIKNFLFQVPYPVFVFSGLLFWNVFSSGLTNSANSMVSNANIIKKIYFPRLIVPISAVLVPLFDFFIALIVYIITLFYYGIRPDVNFFVVMPLALLMCLLTTLGIGSFMAALNVKYRDVKYVVPFFVQLLLFLTPVIYPVSILPYEWMKTVLSLNPVAGAIDLFRSSLTGIWPDTRHLFLSLITSIIFFLVGIAYFRRVEDYFADMA